MNRWAALTDKSFCFEAINNEKAFAGENLINGYARPYAGTNIWQSQQVEGEFFTVKLAEKQTLKTMVLIFDSNLDQKLCSTNKQPFNYVPTLVKDYNVYAKQEDGSFVQIQSIRDNYMRVNKLDLQEIETDEIKVEFLATYGANHISVYSVRLYGDSI